ncbi:MULTISPECIES: tyrosine-type recombinase/integrase [Bacillaceae]|uniref:Site-specific integrase n=1 Tax=Evansella alkalicola TaxID=745819 RepID=A0ABS6JUH9_9BACI|nr:MULTISPECIES: tyrosine-type recombinase/integrase [Bacillaceae]MBU9721349.1 site-specific integrase [Bacillus alkalicola]
MTGNVREDKKKNYFLFTIELGKDETGKRKRIVRRGFKNRTEARKAMTAAIADLYNNEPEKTESNVTAVANDEVASNDSNKSTESEDNEEIKLGDYLDYWLKTYVETNTAYNTFLGYERMIRVHIKPALGDILLSKLKPRDIQDYYTRKVRTENMLDSEEDDGLLSAQSVKHHHRVLSKALSDAVDLEFVEKNVVKKVKPPKVQKLKIITYTSGELELLLNHAVSNEVYGPIIYSAAYTGARLGELRALTWEDVDFKNKKLFICKTAYDVRKVGVKIKYTTKNGQERHIVMGKNLINFLEEHKRKSDHQKKVLGKSFNPNNLVFFNSAGNYVHPSELRLAYKKAVKKAELPDSRFHDMRHSHATILLQANVHPKIVSERLGHSKIGITLDLYSHVIPSLQDSAADIFDSAFDNE